MKPAKSPEVRVLQSLRQSNCITKAQMDQAIALLEATETCDKCGGDGDAAPEGMPPFCNKCESTGQMYSIR